jgi:hypothetical protein
MKKIVLIALLLSMVTASHAQISIIDSAKNELFRINKMFDSSMYLGFNLDMTYRTDSGNINLNKETINGTYVLNKKNMYYQMGAAEFVQTDSFSYSFYNDEKMMIMTKNMITENSGLFPLRNFVDSVVNAYAAFYNISIDTLPIDSTYRKRILFTSNGIYGEAIPFTTFDIQYDDDSYFPTKFQFSFIENPEPTNLLPTTPVNNTTPNLLINNGGGPPPKPEKTIIMQFSKYKGYSNTNIFEDDQYVIFNRVRKIYEPNSKYRLYKFITSGFDNEDPDEQYYYNEAPIK